MDALGNGILDFLAEEPPAPVVEAAKVQIVSQVREWSSTSPLIKHSLGKPRGQSSDPELVKRLLDARPAGADITALILDDYYRHSVGGLAYRSRVGLIVKAVQRAVSRCSGAGIAPVRVLCLNVSGAGEIRSMAEDQTFAEAADVTCVDDRPHALRDARTSLDGLLATPPSFVHADPLRYAERPDRPHQPYHVIYGVSIFEHLEAAPAVRLVQTSCALLAPGGVLIAGSVTTGVPTSEQILRGWLTGWDLQYRDEATWRAIFGRTDFNTRHVQFEYETHRANVVVSAEKSDAIT
jgi:hypothetical protein